MQTIQTLPYPTIAAFGEWSQTNIGDHAIHHGVHEFFDDCGWRVRSFDLGALRPASGPRPGVAAPAHWRSSSVLDGMPMVKRALRGWRQQALMQRLLPSLASCDAICVGGGALLMDSNLHFPQSLAVLSWAAGELEKPLLCLGCSVEGDWSARGRRIVRDFLNRCGFVALRDRASAERIADLLGREVPVFGDFALRLSESRVDIATAPRYLFAVNAMHQLAPHDVWQQRYEDGLVQVVTSAVAQAPAPAGIAVFTTGTAQDLAPAARLCARLAEVGAELHPGRSLDQLRELLHASRAVIATRLHAAIIPLAERVPVIGYAVTPKLGNFFHSIGLDDCHFGPGDATATVVDGLLRVMQHGQPLPASVCTAVQRTRAAAREFLLTLTQPIPYAEAASR